LVYSTYLGGAGQDEGWGIDVDVTGSAYVTGATLSYSFPTVFPYQSSPAYPITSFVTKVSPSGSSLTYSTYLGGSGFTWAYDIAVSDGGSAYVTGFTAADNYPVVDPFQTDQPGDDVFITRLSPGGSYLIYSTYLGGDGEDRGYGIALDGIGNAYVTGVYCPPLVTLVS